MHWICKTDSISPSAMTTKMRNAVGPIEYLHTNNAKNTIPRTL